MANVDLLVQTRAQQVTVRLAMASLETSGLIRKVNGRGSFVT